MNRNSGKGLLRDRRGAVGAWVAVMLVMLLGVAALTIDMGFLWVLRDRLQATADASALAGASQLTTTPDPALVKAEAAAYAQKNMSTSAHGTVLADTDVVLGHWDRATRTFTTNATGTAAPAGETTNAVQVTTRRAEANGNAASLFLASVLGIQKADVVAKAIAEWIGGGSFACFQEGFMAGNQALLGEDILLTNDMCVYGRNGVVVGERNAVNAPSLVGALDASPCAGLSCGTITFGDDVVYSDVPVTDTSGLTDVILWGPEAIVSADVQPQQANDVSSTINDLENGIGWPDQITSLYVGSTLPATLVDGTAYVIYGNVTIDDSRTISNVIIAAVGDGVTGGNFTLEEDSAIVNGTPCAGGRTNIGVLATGDIMIAERATLTGVDLIAGRDATVGHDLPSTATTIQAGRNLIVEERTVAVGGGCDDPVAALPGPSFVKVVLVD